MKNPECRELREEELKAIKGGKAPSHSNVKPRSVSVGERHGGVKVRNTMPSPHKK